MKALHRESCVCVWLNKMCVITVRRMFPKQRLAGPRGGKLLLSNMTTQSNQAWISYLWRQTHILIWSCDFQLSCLLWISYTIFLSPSPLVSISLVLSLPLSCLRLRPSFILWQWHYPHALLFPSPIHKHSCFVSQLISSYYPFVCPFLSSLTLTCLYLLARNIHRILSDYHPSLLSLSSGEVWRPGASCWCEPCCLCLPDTCYQPCRAAWGGSHRDPREREQTPDVAMTETMPESCDIKTIKLGNHCSSIF